MSIKKYSEYSEINSIIILLSLDKNAQEDNLKALANVMDRVYEMAFLKGYERGKEDAVLLGLIEE